MNRMIWFLSVGLTFAIAGCGSGDSKKGSKRAIEITLCGNGQIDPGEACDPAIAEGEGACPTACTAPGCATASIQGNPETCDAECVVEPVACGDGDGCCPLGCDSTTDAECTNTCGDGVVEGPELCDGDCPVRCDTPDACTAVQFTGDPDSCSSACVEAPVNSCVDSDGCCPAGCDGMDSDCGEVGGSCGDGVIDDGETCDGNCPTSCPSQNACQKGQLVGGADTCNAECSYTVVDACVSGDGCCPAGCTEVDDDCSGTCGDGVIDAGETCDLNCPTFCNDNNSCTTDSLTGSASQCSAECVFNPISSCRNDDGCCPSGCEFSNDNDCGCESRTCAELGVQCGIATDACGKTQDCGGCSTGSCEQGMCVSEGEVGSPCSADSDCGIASNGTPLICDMNAPGGFCTTICLPSEGTCPTGSVCNLNLAGSLPAACTPECSTGSDCRSGYRCEANLLGFYPSCVY